jgi:nucleoside permease NupC
VSKVFWEFLVVVFVSMFIISFINRKVGGAELRELEKDIKKLLDKAKKGDETAFKKLNKANSKRLKLSFRTQKFTLPLSLVAILFIKWRYADFQWVIFGHSLSWIWAFFILGMVAYSVSDRIVKRVLKY